LLVTANGDEITVGETHRSNVEGQFAEVSKALLGFDEGDDSGEVGPFGKDGHAVDEDVFQGLEMDGVIDMGGGG
jgi:hypothetical protein